MATKISSIMEQIPFPFSLETAFVFDNFYDKNGMVPIIKASIASPEILHVVGATGKTHVLQSLCHSAKEAGKTATYIPMRQFVKLPVGALEFDTQFDLFCVDDIDEACGSTAWELRLFNLFNRLKDEQRTLVMASKTTVPAFLLPDLTSRIQQLQLLRLPDLSDAMILKALLLHAKSRGIRLDDKVLKFMQRHLPRNMHHLVALLDRLEQVSLIEKRKISVPLLKEAWQEIAS